ncbi:PREDICTED: uncharacterized protein LOC109218827 [Nicotiana attenuata]|uniref:DDT domain-containing protein n=1 Tax=Nicotiana attenuata TaxID=49451 RepID=A0A1J6JUV0_NICAT|nr:PREDICTED: uncharacterized protein LOC109218827 [Nicotiana attenuata]OIT21514.1 hypothetical protein A4A49_37166 [Nicotiana attenuata]
MAVASGSKQKEGKMKSPTKKRNKESQEQSEKVISTPAKRNNCPGVRLVGGRIYDSFNGKTCHQCRQKTMDYMAACKNMRNDKPCPIRFCHKCLLNRYGEKAEEVSLLEDWKCPKCRGICNCSCCMKRRGCQPTGILVHTAKATGYSSVSDMLQTKGLNNIDRIKVLKDTNTTNNEESIVSAENQGKENCVEGVIDLNMHTSHLSKSPSVGCKRKVVSEKPDGRLSLKENNPLGKGKSKRIKQEGATEVNGKTNSHNKRRSENNEVSDLGVQNIPSSEDSPHGGEKKPKKLMQGQPRSNFDSKRGAVASVKETLLGKSQDSRKNNKERSVKEGSVEDNTIENKDPFALTSLPQGTGLTAVGGIDLQSEDIGNALQFLEFCAVFGKILDIKKGLPEAVLRDIMQGRSSRRGKCSLTMQFLSNLLSFLKDEDEERFSAVTSTEGKNTWYADIKMCISESPSVSRTMGLDSLSDGADQFENLSPSEKLKILNFICDEVLETVKIRDWIDDQNTKFAERAKEAKEKVIAAKDEEKRLKQKMQDRIAQALIAKNGAPLSISEHESIVSQIKCEAAEAHASVMESKNTYSKCTFLFYMQVLSSFILHV